MSDNSAGERSAADPERSFLLSSGARRARRCQGLEEDSLLCFTPPLFDRIPRDSQEWEVYSGRRKALWVGRVGLSQKVQGWSPSASVCVCVCVRVCVIELVQSV